MVLMNRWMPVKTVQMYFQDTAEVQEARARFGDAFADAEAGIGARGPPTAGGAGK